MSWAVNCRDALIGMVRAHELIWTLRRRAEGLEEGYQVPKHRSGSNVSTTRIEEHAIKSYFPIAHLIFHAVSPYRMLYYRCFTI